VARVLGFIVLLFCLLLMLGTGICSGYFLILAPAPWGPNPIAVLGLVVAVGSGAAAWRLVIWLGGRRTRPQVDAPAHEDGGSARR
jgi:hypothetical protein